MCLMFFNWFCGYCCGVFGFILIELMIIVVVVVILVVIVYLFYQDQICKLWCVQVKVDMVEYSQMVECFYIVNNIYVGFVLGVIQILCEGGLVWYVFIIQQILVMFIIIVMFQGMQVKDKCGMLIINQVSVKMLAEVMVFGCW